MLKLLLRSVALVALVLVLKLLAQDKESHLLASLLTPVPLVVSPPAKMLPEVKFRFFPLEI